MNGVRAGVLGGLAVTAPVAVWLLGTAATGPAATGTDTGAERALFVATAVAVSIVLPLCAGRLGVRESATAAASLLAVPMPLIAILWLAGAAEAGALVAGFGVLAAFAAVILLISKATARAMQDSFAHALVRSVVQTGAAAGAFASRDVWLGWLGL